VLFCYLVGSTALVAALRGGFPGSAPRLDVAKPVHQPPALDLEHLRHAIQALEVGVLGAPAHDVVDERPGALICDWLSTAWKNFAATSPSSSRADPSAAPDRPPVTSFVTLVPLRSSSNPANRLILLVGAA
jgi:hypothetical protein